MELLFRDDAYLTSCQATVVSADEAGIRLDRTVFYPTGGGQPGDSGQLRLADGGARTSSPRNPSLRVACVALMVKGSATPSAR